jgi:hypothetical protein
MLDKKGRNVRNVAYGVRSDAHHFAEIFSAKKAKNLW